MRARVDCWNKSAGSLSNRDSQTTPNHRRRIVDTDDQQHAIKPQIRPAHRFESATPEQMPRVKEERRRRNLTPPNMPNQSKNTNASSS